MKLTRLLREIADRLAVASNDRELPDWPKGNVIWHSLNLDGADVRVRLEWEKTNEKTGLD